jgi:hypothetical protein
MYTAPALLEASLLRLCPPELASSSDHRMVHRSSRSPLEVTVRTLDVDQCFRFNPSTPFVVIVFPLFSSSLPQGVFVASTQTRSV